jgi:hypothetical protein
VRVVVPSQGVRVVAVPRVVVTVPWTEAVEHTLLLSDEARTWCKSNSSPFSALHGPASAVWRVDPTPSTVIASRVQELAADVACVAIAGPKSFSINDLL